jgi:ankyrin repeat protein
VSQGRKSLTLAIFLERGANPNAADKNGITALHNAAQRGLTSLVGTRYDDSYRRCGEHREVPGRSRSVH